MILPKFQLLETTQQQELSIYIYIYAKLKIVNRRKVQITKITDQGNFQKREFEICEDDGIELRCQ